jgi:hypothetical protein
MLCKLFVTGNFHAKSQALSSAQTFRNNIESLLKVKVPSDDNEELIIELSKVIKSNFSLIHRNQQRFIEHFSHGLTWHSFKDTVRIDQLLATRHLRTVLSNRKRFWRIFQQKKIMQFVSFPTRPQGIRYRQLSHRVYKINNLVHDLQKDCNYVLSLGWLLKFSPTTI